MTFATICTLTGLMSVCLLEAFMLWHEHPHTWPIRLIVSGLCLLAVMLFIALGVFMASGNGPGPGPMSNQDVA